MNYIQVLVARSRFQCETRQAESLYFSKISPLTKQFIFRHSPFLS